ARARRTERHLMRAWLTEIIPPRHLVVRLVAGASASRGTVESADAVDLGVGVGRSMFDRKAHPRNEIAPFFKPVRARLEIARPIPEEVFGVRAPFRSKENGRKEKHAP